jgi:hypothetical protein
MSRFLNPTQEATLRLRYSFLTEGICFLWVKRLIPWNDGQDPASSHVGDPHPDSQPSMDAETSATLKIFLVMDCGVARRGTRGVPTATVNDLRTANSGKCHKVRCSDAP